MRSLVLVIVIFLLLLPAAFAVAQESQDLEKAPSDVAQGQVAEPKPKINNLPFNMYGLSGLMVTTATRTLRPGSFEVGLAGSWEQSTRPVYYDREVDFLAAVGIPGGLEFGLKAPYVMTDLKYALVRNFYTNKVTPTYLQSAASGLGSIEGMLKWGFVQQHQFLPAFAVGVGFIAPGSDYQQGISQVKVYGAKITFAMGLELNDLAFTDYAFAILADGTLVLRDVDVDRHAYEEKHGLVHGGLIFPLHPRNFLELLIEYEGQLLAGTTNDKDINSIVATLRFVTNHFNVTAGARYNFKQDPAFDNSITYIANFSYTYF
jgi:hypothetical protein